MNKLCFLMAVVLLIAFAKGAVGRKGNKKKVHLDTSDEMKLYMNMSVDPCDNFYKFACGNWANEVGIQSSDPFDSLEMELNKKLERILKSETDNIDTDDDKQIKQFYKSCVNIPNLKKKYNEQVKTLIGEFGEMPALYGDQWDENKFDWVDVVGRISFKYRTEILLSYDIEPDLTNNTFNRFMIGQPKLTFQTKVMYQSNSTARYREVWHETIKTHLIDFLDLDEEPASNVASEIVQFEISLADGMIDDTMGLDILKLMRLTTVEKMHHRYAPAIDMNRLVTLMMGKPISEPIYEYVKQYQKNLKKVLSTTPKRTVANYVFYKLLVEFIEYPSDTAEEQETDCVAVTKQYFDLDSIFYRRYRSVTTENNIDFIWQRMKSRFKKNLDSVRMSWMKEETRQHARQKLDAMNLKLNYEEESSSEESSNKSNALALDNEEFVINLANIRKVKARKYREQLYEPPISSRGESYTPVYKAFENTIWMPILLLQKYYLWSDSSPNAVKFGALGSTLGHELIHGFDDYCRMYDKDGNIKDWWDEQSAASFIKRKECFINQYAQYKFNGHLLPRLESQGENIADNGGLPLAYAAYLDWYEEAVHTNRNLSSEMLPNLNFTSKQLFFISYAQTDCSNMNSEDHDYQILADTHLPYEIRIIGSLSNVPEFAKEFNCEAGKPMNPINKCELY